MHQNKWKYFKNCFLNYFIWSLEPTGKEDETATRAETQFTSIEKAHDVDNYRQSIPEGEYTHMAFDSEYTQVPK